MIIRLAAGFLCSPFSVWYDRPPPSPTYQSPTAGLPILCLSGRAGLRGAAADDRYRSLKAVTLTLILTLTLH